MLVEGTLTSAACECHTQIEIKASGPDGDCPLPPTHAQAEVRLLGLVTGTAGLKGWILIAVLSTMLDISNMKGE